MLTFGYWYTLIFSKIQYLLLYTIPLYIIMRVSLCFYIITRKFPKFVEFLESISIFFRNSFSFFGRILQKLPRTLRVSNCWVSTYSNYILRLTLNTEFYTLWLLSTTEFTVLFYFQIQESPEEEIGTSVEIWLKVFEVQIQVRFQKSRQEEEQGIKVIQEEVVIQEPR